MQELLKKLEGKKIEVNVFGSTINGILKHYEENIWFVENTRTKMFSFFNYFDVKKIQSRNFPK